MHIPAALYRAFPTRHILQIPSAPCSLLVFAEHRYFGDSLPFLPSESFTPVPGTKNMAYLTVEQTLLDAVGVVEWAKNKWATRPTSVIAVGAGYSGQLSAWFRLRFPWLVRHRASRAISVRTCCRSDVTSSKRPVRETLGAVENGWNAPLKASPTLHVSKSPVTPVRSTAPWPPPPRSSPTPATIRRRRTCTADSPRWPPGTMSSTGDRGG